MANLLYWFAGFTWLLAAYLFGGGFGGIPVLVFAVLAGGVVGRGFRGCLDFLVYLCYGGGFPED